MSMVNDSGIVLLNSIEFLWAVSILERIFARIFSRLQLFDCGTEKARSGPRFDNWFVLTASLKVMNLCLAA